MGTPLRGGAERGHRTAMIQVELWARCKDGHEKGRRLSDYSQLSDFLKKTCEFFHFINKYYVVEAIFMKYESYPSRKLNGFFLFLALAM